MTTSFFAGEIPSAEKMSAIAGIGEMAANVTGTSDSATWNSATKVLTNLVAAFTAPAAGIEYEVFALVNWSCASASNQDALGIAWKLGTLTPGADLNNLAGSSAPRSHPDATGFNTTPVYGTFTTLAAGAHEVAVVGWKPTGNTGVSKLEGDPAFAINKLTVKRVS